MIENCLVMLRQFALGDVDILLFSRLLDAIQRFAVMLNHLPGELLDLRILRPLLSQLAKLDFKLVGTGQLLQNVLGLHCLTGLAVLHAGRVPTGLAKLGLLAGLIVLAIACLLGVIGPDLNLSLDAIVVALLAGRLSSHERRAAEYE